jgi:hypothetical protein
MRRIVLGGLLVLLAVAPACKQRDLAHARVDAALAPLLPADTVAIGCLRLDKLKNTPFYAKYVAGKRIPALEEFARQTGLDPRESVWELVFSTNGKRTYLFVRGKFGGEFGFEPESHSSAIHRESYKGRYLLSTGDAGVVFMNTGAAVAGKVEDLKALVDGFDAPSGASPQALFDLAATLPGTAQVWAVSEQPSLIVPPAGGMEDRLEGSFAGNLVRAGRRVTRLKVWGDLSQGLELHIQAQAANPADAESLRDAAKAAIGMGRLGTRDNQPEMLKLYDGLSSSSDGPIVHIDAREPFELIDTAIEKLPFGRRPLLAK